MDWAALERENEKLLEEFEEKLREEGFSQYMVDEYIAPVERFLQEYLVRYEIGRPEEVGPSDIDFFIGEECIRRGGEADTSWLRVTLEALARFYRFLSTKTKVAHLEAILKVCSQEERYLDKIRAYAELNPENWEDEFQQWASDFLEK